MSKFEYHRQQGSFGMFPPVIKALLMVNVGVFLFQMLFDGVVIGDSSVRYMIMEWLALNPASDSIMFGDSNFYPWQLISYQFLHGGFFHLFFNMFALWMFGIELEHIWGSSRFLTFYLLSGIGAGLLQIFISDAPTVGASGAVYGILLGFGMTFPDRKIFMFPLFIPISAKYFVMIFAGIELMSGLFSSNSGIAHFAHLGGAATGFLLLKYGDQFKIYEMFDKLWVGLSKIINSNSSSSANKRSANVYSQTSQTKWRSSTSASTGTPTQTRTTYSKSYVIDGEEITQNTIDDILDKISATGYQNLTDREKFILNELSKRL
jgi:membrane associated rhomboid family serine protease